MNKYNRYVEERIISEAIYMIKNKTTVRETAKKFGVSKSTVHNDITKKLLNINSRLAKHCKKYKIEKSDMVKYLRWGVGGRILLPVEKCRHAKNGGSKHNVPIPQLTGNKIVCLTYCLYHQEGKLTCPYWRGKK